MQFGIELIHSSLNFFLFSKLNIRNEHEFKNIEAKAVVFT